MSSNTCLNHLRDYENNNWIEFTVCDDNCLPDYTCLSNYHLLFQVSNFD